MNEVLHANIFFFIASIATVIFCILTCIILYHVLKIAKSIRSIVERVDASSEQIAQDISNVREFVASGSAWGRVVQFLMSFAGGFGRGGRRSRKKDK
jgi:hypothetical protein